MPVSNTARRGIQSVGIGMRVLSAVAAHPGPSTLSSIAQRAALSPSQTHRYLSSLMAAGMLKQEGRSGLYDLDAGAIRVGLAALSRIDLFSSADAYLKKLVLETRRTALVAVWGDAGPTIVRWFAGSPPVMTALSIGSNLPLLRSATGRVFYAFGDQIEMDRQARLIEMHDPAGVPTDLAALRDQIRRDGIATISGDFIPGLRAAAAPVLDLQGNLVLVASLVTGTTFPASGDAAANKALQDACQRTSSSIGGVQPIELLDEPREDTALPRRAKRDGSA
jgi:DNA-binding IclR family transcriptional regulator